MSAKRKLWATSIPGDLKLTRRVSETAIYRDVVPDYAERFVATGEPVKVIVWDDEQMGRGWQKYDVVDMAEYVAIDKATEGKTS